MSYHSNMAPQIREAHLQAILSEARGTANPRTILYDALILLADNDKLILQTLRHSECMNNNSEEMCLAADELLDEASRYHTNTLEAHGHYD